MLKREGILRAIPNHAIIKELNVRRRAAENEVIYFIQCKSIIRHHARYIRRAAENEVIRFIQRESIIRDNARYNLWFLQSPPDRIT